MPATMKALGIDRLTIDERIGLMDEIWESITSEAEQLPINESLRTEIASRLEDHRANPDDVVPWEVIKAEAEARFSR